ncbi:MAG: sugar phosphate isomerase/epimerase family protein [Planctomycetota bacterium]|nr:sugar phosphate isomerase/epimerase family protein [Planctomycetota bacterium]
MAKHVVGAALWSLAMDDTVASLEKVAEIGYEAVQLTFRQESDVTPEGLDRIRAALERTDLTVPAGCIIFPGEDYSSIQSIRATGGFIDPNDFPERLEQCKAWSGAFADLGIDHVTIHAGFIPPAGDDAHPDFMERFAIAVDAIHDAGLTVGLETGQESGEDLLRAMDELGRECLSVNFDPANFVLYGSDDPLAAARILGPRTSMAHMKDGTASDRPGEVWGDDVPLGTGEVPLEEVIRALEAGGFTGALVVEREAGDDRIGDLARAREMLERLLARMDE